MICFQGQTHFFPSLVKVLFTWHSTPKRHQKSQTALLVLPQNQSCTLDSNPGARFSCLLVPQKEGESRLCSSCLPILNSPQIQARWDKHLEADTTCLPKMVLWKTSLFSAYSKGGGKEKEKKKEKRRRRSHPSVQTAQSLKTLGGEKLKGSNIRQMYRPFPLPASAPTAHSLFQSPVIPLKINQMSPQPCLVKPLLHTIQHAYHWWLATSLTHPS